ncbi:MAG: hypothetical protein EPO06_09245 [Burkholderiaceae bacterium]|nr:MAG: hypothetical protein EPO06_09245 [Burkholderiaceae bacterium]
MKLNLEIRQFAWLESLKRTLSLRAAKSMVQQQWAALTRLTGNAASLVRDSLAVIGFAAIAFLVLVSQNDDLRNSLSEARKVSEWLRPGVAQQFSRLSEQTAAQDNQMTALMGLDDDASSLYPQQASFEKGEPYRQEVLSRYLAKRYRVSQDAANLVVGAAFSTGKEISLDPLLILSVMAVESSLNPFAESTVGAQGLMQVLSQVHEDKLEVYGGKMAALNPVVNIKVGAIILRDCIRRGGSLEAGLKLYVGATTPTDGGYADKVIAVRSQLQQALGMPVSQTPAAVMSKPADQPADQPA